MNVSPNPARSHADWQQLESLYRLYLTGDGAATRALFTEISRVLTGFFRIRMGAIAEGRGEVEDMAQATLLKLHFSRDRYDPEKSLKTWVFTIATRSLIDHWRGAAIENEHFEDRAGEDSESGLDQLLETLRSDELDPERKTLLHRDLNQALSQLKPMERSIVYLYGVEGLSMAEIAETFSITESAAKLRAHRAYKELRQSLGLWAVIILGLYSQAEHLWT